MKLNKILLGLALFCASNTLYAQVASIPFAFNGKHLYIKIKTLKSRDLNFVFDTGATGATIDSATAENAGISKTGRETVNIAGSGGSQDYVIVPGQSLTLGSVTISPVELTMVNFSNLSGVMGVKLDGILGFELLERYVTLVDFDQSKLVMYKGINEADTTGYTGIPFEFSKGINIPRFPITITLANGETFTGKVMFDTGNGFSLIVSTPFSKFHNFQEKIGDTKVTMGRGMNAVTQDQLANIKAMSFNGFTFGTMGIRLTVNEKAEARDGYLGVLGIEVIKRFNIILDYVHKKIYLKPNKAYFDSFSQN